jgi:hypothetical protein
VRGSAVLHEPVDSARRGAYDFTEWNLFLVRGGGSRIDHGALEDCVPLIGSYAELSSGASAHPPPVAA